jgi:hypothetical protein
MGWPDKAMGTFHVLEFDAPIETFDTGLSTEYFNT